MAHSCEAVGHIDGYAGDDVDPGSRDRIEDRVRGLRERIGIDDPIQDRKRYTNPETGSNEPKPPPRLGTTWHQVNDRCGTPSKPRFLRATIHLVQHGSFLAFEDWLRSRSISIQAAG